MKRVLSQDEILKAIACDGWQRFRVSLKGNRTWIKLDKLRYYRGTGSGCCGQDRRDVQVLNYLNALARGGQIAPLPDNFDFNGDWVVRVTIQK